MMKNNTMDDILYFRRSLPFYPSSKQIIYIEDGYNTAVNAFIRKNYENLSSSFSQSGYDFCYLPTLADRLGRRDIIQYFTPYQSAVAHDSSFSSDCLNRYAKRGSNLSAAFILYDSLKSNSRYWGFRAMRLSDVDMEAQVAGIINQLQEEDYDISSDIRYCNTSSIEDYFQDDNYADRFFSEEVTELMEDVRHKIDKLRQHGVNEMVLRMLLCPTTKLSRLHITSSYRILLPDYGNLEIKMTPLVKAVFLLFLRHSDGIVFKTLPDYRSELLDIYGRLTGRASNEQIRQSIADVTNPCNNSINEKCARIREAFVREFDDRLAEYYYVTGERGQAKRIRLPRNLVHWEKHDPF